MLCEGCYEARLPLRGGHRNSIKIAALLAVVTFSDRLPAQNNPEIGREVAIPHHLQDGEEFDLSIKELIAYGKKLFEAHFTAQGRR